MKKELPKTEVDWSKFPKATQEKVKMEKMHNKIINGFQEEHKQDRTCNNNCSVVCGECQIFELKQETLEEFAKREAKKFYDNGGSLTDLIILGAKWQQERMYNEEDMIEFSKFMLLGNHEYKSYQEIFNEWFEQFKK